MGHITLDMANHRNTPEKFWAMVDKCGPIPKHCPELGPCWIWTRTPDKDGYGRFSVRHKSIYAHRFAFKQAGGRLDRRHCVCHKCDVCLCVNPSHLFSGTWIQNRKDCVAKRRHSFGEKSRLASLTHGFIGERNPAAKLTNEQVVLIRKFLNLGIAAKDIAETYGVTPTAICAIKSGKTWSQI